MVFLSLRSCGVLIMSDLSGPVGDTQPADAVDEPCGWCGSPRHQAEYRYECQWHVWDGDESHRMGGTS